MDSTTVPLMDASSEMRNLTNHTDSSETVDYFNDEQLAFLVFLLIAIVIGNSIVLVAVCVSRRKTRMTFFIKHLATADLLVGIFSVFPDLIWRITFYWHAGLVMCKIVKYLQCVVTYGSTFVLVALSIDRFDAIARPMNFSSWRRCKILIGVAWGIAALFSVPSLILFKTKHGHCGIDLGPRSNWQIYLTLIAVAVFFIPAIAITLCYGAIIIAIWRHNKVLHSINKTKEDPSMNKSLYSQDGNRSSKQTRYRTRQTSASSQGIIKQAKIRTIKMTFAIVIAFILCWSPYFIWNLLYVYGKITHNSSAIRAASAFIQSLAPLNSAANPVIYGIFSTRICRYLRRFAFIRAILGACSCCGDPNEGSTTYRDRTSAYTATEVTDYTCSKNNTRYTKANEKQIQGDVQRSPESSTDRTLVEKPQSIEMCDLILSSVRTPNGMA